MKITDEMAKKAAVEFLSYRGERPFRVTRRGAELWEDYTEAMRFALTAALSAAPEAVRGKDAHVAGDDDTIIAWYGANGAEWLRKDGKRPKDFGMDRPREYRPVGKSCGATVNQLDGSRPLPYDRETLGRFVREAWVRWAETQQNHKPSWLVPYDDLSEPDKEADRQIGENLASWTLIGDAARTALATTEGSTDD